METPFQHSTLLNPCKDWSCLPVELALNILSRLPLIEFQKLRTVCKAWNHLAVDPEFLRLRDSLSRSRPGFALFLTSDETSEMLYLDLNDPREWRTISFSYLPRSSALKFLASSGGLLLLGCKGKEEEGDLLVVNPVTKEWRVLPKPAVIRDFFYTALWAEGEGGGFVVVVAESELREAAATEVFRSEEGRWRKAATPSMAGRWKRIAAPLSTPWFYGSVPVSCMPVYCDGAFYHLTWDPEDMVSEFHVADHTWRCAKGRGAVPSKAPWGVMELAGKVLLVEMSYLKDHGSQGDDATLSLWELQRESLKWVRIACIPPPPESEFRIDRWQRYAVGDGFVCTTFLVPGTIITFSSQSNKQRGMLFDVAQTCWLPMPDLPGTPSGHISSLFSFSAALHPLRPPLSSLTL